MKSQQKPMKRRSILFISKKTGLTAISEPASSTRNSTISRLRSLFHAHTPRCQVFWFEMAKTSITAMSPCVICTWPGREVAGREQE